MTDERHLLPKQEIMVVDDTPTSLHLLARILSTEGYTVRPALNGRIAIASALNDPPDLILLDVAMPGEDGYQVCARFKEDERTRLIPVIFVSARDESEAVVKGFSVGGVDYITKPFSSSEVLARVRTHMALRCLQKQLETRNVQLQQEIRVREQVERELRMHKIHLEELVAESTADLRKINEELQQEIEERKRAEEAMRESERRFRSLVETTSDWVWEVDGNGVYTYASPKVRDFLGYEPEEVLGRTPFDFMPPNEAKRMGAFFRGMAGSRLPYVGVQSTSLNKSGRQVVLESSGEPIFDGEGNLQGYRGIDRDITGLKRAEEERKRLVTAIEQAAEGVVVTDADGIIDYVNPAFERMTGYYRTESIGRSIHDLLSGGDRAVFQKPGDTVRQGGTWSGRSKYRRKDGSSYEAETTISPVRDEYGDIINWVSIHRDITHEVKLERELRQAQKMEAIGTLAGGIAHDFNNILMAICGYTEMTLQRLPTGSSERRNLDQVLKASRRAADLVSQILAFSRQAEHERKPVNVVPLVKETLKLLRSSLPTTIEIQQEIDIFDRNGGIILADPTQIHQVLMNLCANSAYAMRAKGGILTVRLSSEKVDADLLARHPHLKAGPYVCLTVSDTGQGMEPAILERIFDPYFTTKEPGEGTGLGLAVVQGIVKGCGGAISVTSEPGRGTTFNVFLEEIREGIAAGPAVIERLQGGTERILFVDDERSLVDLGKEMLESLGYTVITRTNSVEAWQTFHEDPTAFDMVITDMTMPNVTGLDLAGSILSIRPNLPIVLCTGFSEIIDGKEAREAGIREFVMKPYQLTVLAKTVRRALDG